MARFRPFGVGAADAVQQIEHRVLATGRVAGRRVDAHPAARSERLGVVLDGRQLAVRDIVTLDIEPGRRIGEGGLVVRAQLDRSAEAASAAASAGLRRRGAGCRGLLGRRERSGGQRQTHGGLGIVRSPICLSQTGSNSQNGREQSKEHHSFHKLQSP